MVRKITGLLVSLILLLLLLEGMLAIADPLGMAYYNDEAAMWYQFVDDPRGYGLPPGRYQLTRWGFTILEDRTRAVPATQAGETEVVFIGDSVTFGYGVEDEHTWVNLVAQALPQAHLINATLPGYNSTNALNTLELFPEADIIVYLIISNDVFVPWHEGPFKEAASIPRESYLRLYLTHTGNIVGSGNKDDLARLSLAAGDMERFYRDLDAIASDKRVILIGFDDVFGEQLSERYAVQLIDWYTGVVSRVDGHANVEGNRQIAEQMTPILQAAMN